MSETISPERLYLLLYDETKKREAMETRLKRLEDFIQGKYAGELSPAFVGDHGELGSAPGMQPVVIDFVTKLVEELPQTIAEQPTPEEAAAILADMENRRAGNVQQGK